MEIIQKTIREIETLIKTGKTPPSKVERFYGGDINWYTPGDLDKGKFLGKSNRTITKAAIDENKATMLPKNTVVIGAIGDIGKIAITSIESSTNQQITAIRTNEEVYFEFFYYWLKSNKELLQSRARNALLPILNNENIRSIKIRFPKSIEYQMQISKVLSKCDELIQMRRESIALVDDLLNSTFMEMFKDELAEKNKENWIPLGQAIELLADYHANGSYESLNEKITIKTEKDFALMVRTTDLEKNDFDSDCRYLNEEEYNYLSKSKIFGNEIIITKIGSAGNVYLMPVLSRPVSLGMNAFLLRLKETFEPVFIYRFLTTPLAKSSIMRNVKGAVTKTITKDAVRRIQIPIVDPKKQNDFKLIVEHVEIIKKQLKNSLKELESLYGSISQRAFNGELDLSKVDISDMENSKEEDLEAVKEDLTEEQFDELINSFEHNLPTGEVPSNRVKDIRNVTIRQYLGHPEDDDATKGIEFFKMDKDYFYQFILTQGFPDRTFTLPELERYASNYILRGTGFEFTYENWKNIIFRFIGAKQPIIEQVFDEDDKTIKLKLTDEAFKV
jgi:type I restriction enzyme S subunit